MLADALMFINSDITVHRSIAAVAAEVDSRLGGKFLVTGRRFNVGQPAAKGEGPGPAVLYNRWAQDYFVFKRSTFTSVPPFAIGRALYDNWCATQLLDRCL